MTNIAQASVMCRECGNVVSESGIVNELQFYEDRGAVSLAGQFFSTDGAVGGYTTSSSRSRTIEQFRRQLQEMATTLNLPSHYPERAKAMYQACLSQKFTRGRKNRVLAAALLYIVGRRENSNHLLIDYADMLGVSVYDLSRYIVGYLRLTKDQLPPQDPQLFVARFVYSIVETHIKPTFTPTTNQSRPFASVAIHSVDQLCELAIRAARNVLKRCIACNLHVGRLPSGIVGACIYIALKALNYGLGIHQISHCVFCSSVTVERRLQEIEEHEVFSLLTIEQLLEEDVASVVEYPVAQCLPPSVRFTRLREQLSAERMARLQRTTTTTSTTGLPIDISLADHVDIEQYVAPEPVRKANCRLFDAEYGPEYELLLRRYEEEQQPRRIRRSRVGASETAAAAIAESRALPAAMRDALVPLLEDAEEEADTRVIQGPTADEGSHLHEEYIDDLGDELLYTDVW